MSINTKTIFALAAIYTVTVTTIGAVIIATRTKKDSEMIELENLIQRLSQEEKYIQKRVKKKQEENEKLKQQIIELSSKYGIKNDEVYYDNIFQMPDRKVL